MASESLALYNTLASVLLWASGVPIWASEERFAVKGSGLRAVLPSPSCQLPGREAVLSSHGSKLRIPDTLLNKGQKHMTEPERETKWQPSLGRECKRFFFLSFSIFFLNFPTGMLLKLNPPLCCWVHLLANQMDPASLFFPKLWGNVTPSVTLLNSVHWQHSLLTWVLHVKGSYSWDMLFQPFFPPERFSLCSPH